MNRFLQSKEPIRYIDRSTIIAITITKFKIDDLLLTLLAILLTVKIDGEILKEVYIGSNIFNADALIVLSHFKGHEMTGFGGAIKNVGMGCASKRGKFHQHSGVYPKIIKEKCTGCVLCVNRCSFNAISLINKIATIDEKKCKGCGDCLVVCKSSIPSGKVEIDLANDVIFKGANIVGISGRKMFDTWYRVAGLLESKRIDISPVITHKFPLEEFKKGFELMMSEERKAAKILLFP